MGQQQLLLLVLGVIIVGIAVAVGITMFSSSAVDANSDAVSAQVLHLGSKATQHFKKPSAMGGGNNSFEGFTLSKLDYGEAAGNCFVVVTTLPTAAAAKPANDAAVLSAQTTIGSGVTTIHIVGYGTEIGIDGALVVQSVGTVTAGGFTQTRLN